MIDYETGAWYNGAYTRVVYLEMSGKVEEG